MSQQQSWITEENDTSKKIYYTMEESITKAPLLAKNVKNFEVQSSNHSGIS